MPVVCHLTLEAELLTADVRLPLTLVQELAAIAGEVVEIAVPDGTLNRVLVPPRGGRLNALLVTSDKTIRVTIGPAAQNQALTLAPGGMLLLGDTEVLASTACAVSYTPGDGSAATCLVVVGTSYAGMPIVEGWEWFDPYAGMPLTLQWTETWA